MNLTLWIITAAIALAVAAIGIMLFLKPSSTCAGTLPEQRPSNQQLRTEAKQTETDEQIVELPPIMADIAEINLTVATAEPPQLDLSIEVPQACFINLNDRSDRLFHAIPSLKELGYTKAFRVQGVRMTPGYMGCTTSHIRAVEYMQEHAKDDKWCLIAEDDISIQNTADLNLVKRALRELEDCVVFNLAHNAITWGEDTHIPHIKRLKKSWTASCLIIRVDYLETLRECYQSALDTENDLDVEWHTLQDKDGWYAITPAMGVQGASYSDIRNRPVDYGV